MFQLDVKKASLDGIEASVIADYVVVILASLSVIAKGSHALRKRWIACGHRTGFSTGSQIFSWIEAEGGGTADRACFSPSLFTT